MSKSNLHTLSQPEVASNDPLHELIQQGARAEVYNLESLSAHGDYNEILHWLEVGTLKPEKVYIMHGEILTSDVMRKRVRDRFGWDVEVAVLLEEVEV